MNLLEQQQYFAPLYAKYGAGYLGADWGSKESQAARLTVLSEMARLDAFLKSDSNVYPSVLDVGCGGGLLLDFLPPSWDYMGWDVTQEAVKVARARYPGREFLCHDVLSVLPHQRHARYDYVLASGLFTYGDASFFWSAIEAMWPLCTRALAFNFLTTWGSQHTPGEFQTDPTGVLAACRQLTGKFMLRTDYLGCYDATIVMYR
jgi:SAM-dependent methyltransferase